MLFNSLDFAFFLPIVFALYWLLKSNLKTQNLLVVLASYVFYGWWDWRFLSLIFFSTIVDFWIGKQLKHQQEKHKRRVLLLISILVNIGFLGFFKYYNFFVENFIEAFSLMGMTFKAETLNIVLPVGISFYTFQTLSYSIDVYKKKLEPTNDFLSFMAYVSFFPQLVAGPIERATHLLPQFYSKRHFNYAKAVDGSKQILWGFFKKLVIADNCSIFANQMFNNTGDYSGTTLILGAVFFAFQIYGDFSGYSDIAIGTSRLFGFDLRRNFAFPYFSRDIAEFWRRWHISLSTWFRDYLYIPLGGSKGSRLQQVRNTFIIFLVSGFWHGANWTFIFWGAINALYFLPLLLTKRNRKNIEIAGNNNNIPSLRELIGIVTTFSLTVFAWIFFRAQNLSHAFEYIEKIATGLFVKESLVDTYILTMFKAKYLIILLIIFILVEWIGRKQEFAIQSIFMPYRKLRWIMYASIVFLIGMYMPTTESPFIYFQF